MLAVPRWLRSHHDLAADVDRLEAENAQLRSELATSDYDRNRLQEYDDLTATAEPIGYALVPARVVGIGAGAVVLADRHHRRRLPRRPAPPTMTVVNGDGLVGRVIRVTTTTATVLLVVDADSTVGGRVGRSMKVGFLHGRGDLGAGARGSTSSCVDQTYVPARGDTVVTWGSEDGAPYVSGVPVGRVDSVYSSLRETTQRAVIDPYVDFCALDLVGVVVPVRHRRATGPSSRRTGACGDARCCPRRARSPPSWRSRWRWCCRSRCSRTSRSQGVVPDLVLLVVVAAGARARLRARAGARLRAPGCCSTWPRRPTTSPAAGRWR